MRKQYKDIETCPLAGIQKVVHGKLTMVIIYYLSETTLRFSELKRKIPQVTEANLTKELRMLEGYGLVHREVYREVPPKVEYSLTEIGKQFLPVMFKSVAWTYYERAEVALNGRGAAV